MILQRIRESTGTKEQLCAELLPVKVTSDFKVFFAEKVVKREIPKMNRLKILSDKIKRHLEIMLPKLTYKQMYKCLLAYFNQQCCCNLSFSRHRVNLPTSLQPLFFRDVGGNIFQFSQLTKFHPTKGMRSKPLFVPIFNVAELLNPKTQLCLLLSTLRWVKPQNR